MRCLVMGASGFVGRALVPALCEAGEQVRAASRHAVEVPDDAQWVAADLESYESLLPVLDGIDCAYYLAHSMGHRRRDFREVDQRCAENFVRAAEFAGVRRIVYLGGVAPRGEPSQHLASRLEVGEILRSGMVPTLELRAAMIIGNGSASWQILRDLALRLPFMVLPKWLESRASPIALPDAITALVDGRELRLVCSTWFDIPGPEEIRAREMLEIVAALHGRRIPAIRVPVLTPRLSALWLKLITRTDFSLARELVLGLRGDLVADNARYWQLTGHPPQWTFRAAAAHALSTERPGSRPARVLERAVHRVSFHQLESASRSRNV
jgi:uncharacterized protein YbjT (DUF2867 family)